MNIINTVVNKVISCIGKVEWKQTRPITDLDKAKILSLLIDNYFVVLTHRRNHLSTYMISFANFFLTGKFSFWSHALMNLEDTVNDIHDFRLIEAIGTGTQYSTFDQVFGTVDAVVLLAPKRMTQEEWVSAMEKANSYIGTPYDTLFDLKTDKALSCVELVRDALKTDPEYDVEFAEFEKTIAKRKNLTPQMYYECNDFVKVLEIRR